MLKIRCANFSAELGVQFSWIVDFDGRLATGSTRRRLNSIQKRTSSLAFENSDHDVLVQFRLNAERLVMRLQFLDMLPSICEFWFLMMYNARREVTFDLALDLWTSYINLKWWNDIFRNRSRRLAIGEHWHQVMHIDWQVRTCLASPSCSHVRQASSSIEDSFRMPHGPAETVSRIRYP